MIEPFIISGICRQEGLTCADHNCNAGTYHKIIDGNVPSNTIIPSSVTDSEIRNFVGNVRPTCEDLKGDRDGVDMCREMLDIQILIM